MIEGHVGLPGSGKSLHAVQLLVNARKAGRATYANFHSRTGVWRFALWEEMVTLDNALVVIDEAQMWFGARAWQNNKQTDLGVFQQHRKEGIDMVYVAQHEARVDAAIREITAYYWVHQMIGPSWILARRYTPEDRKRCTGRRFIRADKRLWRHYWTEEVIGGRDGSGYAFGAGSAYGSAATGAGPGLDAKCRLLPNLVRLEWPDGRSSWSSLQPGAGLRSAVERCVGAWKDAGTPMCDWEVAQYYYRARDGVTQRIDLDGGAVSLPEDEPTLVGQFVEAVRTDWAEIGKDVAKAARARVDRARVKRPQ